VVAEDGGAEAQAQAGCFSVRLCGSVGVEGAIRLEEAGTGVSHQNLHQVSLAGCLQTDGLGVGEGRICGRALSRVRAIDRFNGKL